MTVREFRQIERPDFRPAIAAVGAAGESFKRGFTNLGNVLDEQKAAADARIDADTRTNEQSIRTGIESIGSLGELNQAEESGAFQSGTLGKQFGTRYSQANVKGYVDAARNRLQTSTTNAAFSAAREDLTSGNVEAGATKVYEAVKAQGGNEAFASKTTADWRAQATGVRTGQRAEADYQTKQTKKADTLSSGSAASDYAKKVAGGMDQGQAAAESTQGLSEQARQMFQEKRTAKLNQYTELSTEAQREYTNRESTRNAEGEALRQSESAKINAAKTQLQRLPRVNTQATTQAFGVEGVKNMDSVMATIGSQTGWGRFKQTKALTDLYNRYSKKPGYGTDGAAGALAQAWIDVKATSDHWFIAGGQAIVVKALEERMEINKAIEDQYRAEAAKVAAVEAKEAARVLQYESRTQALLNKFHKQQVASKFGGKTPEAFPVRAPATPPKTTTSAAEDFVQQRVEAETPPPITPAAVKKSLAPRKPRPSAGRPIDSISQLFDKSKQKNLSSQDYKDMAADVKLKLKELVGSDPKSLAARKKGERDRRRLREAAARLKRRQNQ